MPGWTWNWDILRETLQANSDAGCLLLSIGFLLLTLGVQGVFYPVLHHMLHFQAPSAIRLAYILAVLLGLGVLHILSWDWLFAVYHDNYWMWLAWIVVMLAIVLALALVPKKRYG